MLICNQLRLNFEFWRSSFARMLVGVASKIKRLSSAQVWRSSVSQLLVVTASAPIEKIGVGVDKGGNFSLTTQNSFGGLSFLRAGFSCNNPISRNL